MSNTRQDKNGKPNYDRAFCIRMKSTLTKRGCHFKSSGYRVVLMLGKLRPQYSYSSTPSGGVPGKKHSPPIMGFIGLAIALPPPSVHEVRLEADMFVTRLAFDFKIAHCEPKVSELLDYGAEDLTGKSMYALVHAGDVDKIKQTHVDLIKKGQVMSNYYRLMNRRGGYTWMQICATLVCNSKNSDEQSIICVNYVLSGAQHSHLVMDKHQVDQPVGSGIKQDSTEEPGDIRNGTPESLKGTDSVEYSNQGSEGGGEQHGHGDGAYYPDQPHLRLGQTPVATPDHGLRSPGTPEEKPSSTFEKGPVVQKDTHDTDNVSSQGSSKRAKNTASPQVHVSSPSPPVTLPQTSQSKTSRYSPPVSQSTTRYSGSTITDQNCNSVRDLENAMSKHLPKDKSPDNGAQSPTMQTTSSMSSHLLKQFYSRQAGYLSDLQSEHADGGQTPAGGGFSLQSYARLAAGPNYAGPAAPVPLKPNTSSHLYSPAAMMGNEPTAYAGSAAAFPADAHQQTGHALYTHPGVSSFHLYNRTTGQNWYSGGN